jgi:hypothetical protein
MSKITIDNSSWTPSNIVHQQSGHMIIDNVKKPSKIKYINIDGRFQEEYNSNKDATFIYQLPQKITDVKSIAVRTAEIPMTFFNFSKKKGNTSFNLNTIYNNISYPTTCIIPDGNYTVNSLQNKIQSILNSKDNALSIVNNSNPVNPFSSICWNSNSVINEGFSYSIDWNVDICGNFQKYNFKSSLGWYLGYRNYFYIIPPDGPTSTEPPFSSPQPGMLNSEGVIDVYTTRYLFLVVDEFRSSNPNSFLSPLSSSLVSKNILARITLNSAIYPYGSILPANTFNGFLLSDQRVYAGKTDIQKLQISLVDEWGNIVDLNGVDFSFCLEIEHE